MFAVKTVELVMTTVDLASHLPSRLRYDASATATVHSESEYCVAVTTDDVAVTDWYAFKLTRTQAFKGSTLIKIGNLQSTSLYKLYTKLPVKSVARGVRVVFRGVTADTIGKAVRVFV